MAPGLSVVQYMLIQDALLVLFIAFQPRSFIVRLSGVFAIVSLVMQAANATKSGPTKDYFFGFFMAYQTLVSVQMLLLRKPLDQLHHERDPPVIGEMSLWRRVYWAICLDWSWRGVAWTHQVNNLPSRPTVGRGKFIKFSLLRLLITFFLTDATNTFVLYQVRRQSTSSEDVSSTLNAYCYYYFHRAITIWAWVYVTVGIATMQYLFLAVVSVALGLHPPSEWPDNFGRLGDAYTLRNFWGKVWHQNLRRLFAPVSTWIVDNLGVTRGTNTSSYIQLYTAFILSGLVHSTGDAFVAWKFAGTSLPFFMSQPLAITIEDAVVALGKRAGVKPSPVTYFAGYFWVFCWGAYSFSTYRDVSVKAGWDWLAEWEVSPSTRILKVYQSD